MLIKILTLTLIVLVSITNTQTNVRFYNYFKYISFTIQCSAFLDTSIPILYETSINTGMFLNFLTLSLSQGIWSQACNKDYQHIIKKII